MTPMPSIRIVKNMDYRSGSKAWGNRYYFNTASSIGETVLSEIITAVVLKEKAALADHISYLEGYGYEAGSDVPIVTVDLSASAGTLDSTGHVIGPGDAAVVLKWTTSQRTSKNHPINLYSYFHGVILDDSDSDSVLSDQVTAMQTYADDWTSGITFGGGAGEVSRAGPNGAIGLVGSVLSYVRHRDFVNR